eukprot:scaffold13590_cov101-Isochrysis_galbana.AAC.7
MRSTHSTASGTASCDNYTGYASLQRAGGPAGAAAPGPTGWAPTWSPSPQLERARSRPSATASSMIFI